MKLENAEEEHPKCCSESDWCLGIPTCKDNLRLSIIMHQLQKRIGKGWQNVESVPDF